MQSPGPERVGSAASLPLFSSYAAGGMKRPELMAVPTAMSRAARQTSRSASQTRWVRDSGMPWCSWSLPPFVTIDDVTVGMGCRAVSVRHLLENHDAPWVGFRPWVGCQPRRRLRSRECQPRRRPSDGWERSAVKRSVPDGVQQPEGSTPTTEPCPTGEGPTSNPDRRTGPRTEDLNTPPVRSALPAESNLKSAVGSIPSWAPGESESIPKVNPGNRDRAPKISMAGNLGKARQRSYYQPDSARGIDSPCGGYHPNQ